MNLQRKIKHISGNVFSRQTGVFLIFLVLSAALWVLTSMGDETQRKVTCELQVTGIPDGTEFVKPVPKTVDVMVRGTGIRLIPTLWQENPVIKIDYETYATATRLVLSRQQLIDLAKNAFNGKLEVMQVTPDTISVPLVIKN